MSREFFLKLDNFEGPLDLLLHLIKVNELDIFNIDLYVLTKQYLKYLRLIKFKDLKAASTFIGMASTLIEIKTRSLLPKEGKDGDSEEDLEEDPAESLQRRLFELETIRNATDDLATRANFNLHNVRDNFEHIRLEEEYADVSLPLRGEAINLLVLYEQMLSSLADRKPVSVQAVTESVTVENIIDRILTKLEEIEIYLFQNFYQKITSRYELVAYVLAILQMVRDNQMNIYQDELHGPIWLYKKDLPLEESGEKSIKSRIENVQITDKQHMNDAVKALTD